MRNNLIALATIITAFGLNCNLMTVLMLVALVATIVRSFALRRRY
jgi:hypothetical protein